MTTIPPALLAEMDQTYQAGLADFHRLVSEMRRRIPEDGKVKAAAQFAGLLLTHGWDEDMLAGGLAMAIAEYVLLEDRSDRDSVADYPGDVHGLCPEDSGCPCGGAS